MNYLSFRRFDSLRWAWLITCLLLSPALHAQPFALTHSVIANGGGTSTNQQYMLTGTIAQAVTSTSTNSASELASGFWYLPILVQSPDAPTLLFTKSGSNLVLSWPATSATFALQETTSLKPPIVWITSSATPVINGDTVSVTVPITGGLRFFRLYHHE